MFRLLMLTFGLTALFGAQTGCAVPDGGSSAAAGPLPPADLLLHDAEVYTMDAARTWADAVAVVGGRIAWVGAEGEAQRWAGPDTEVLDLDGRMLLPGFLDAHVHPVSGGIELGECDLNALTTREAILERVRQCAADGGEDEWVRGGGWQLPVFPNADPRKELLDEVAPGRPVYLSAADGHSAWVSSRALEIAGIDATTPDPPGGRIERDARTGEPSGTLREAATRLVARHLPEHTPEDRVEGLRRALELANGFGITAWQEANGSREDLEAYASLDARGALTVRTRVSMGFEPERLDAELPRLREQRQRFQGARLRAGAAKIFADGVIEAHTAALLEPYTGLDHRGEANLTAQRFGEVATRLDAEGFQIHTHAIGDRAIRMTLDAYAAARAANGTRDARHQIAHIQLFHPDDIGRFRELRVVANFQPLWAFADTYITELTLPVLGPERSRWIYPVRSVADSGAVLACGSDWTVTSMDPLEAIQVAMTRTRPDAPAEGTAPDREPFIPEERADLDTLLACYTIDAAWALFLEEEVGSVEAGKAADLIVLDRNLFETPAAEIHEARVLLTLLRGEAVFRDPGLQAGSLR